MSTDTLDLIELLSIALAQVLEAEEDHWYEVAGGHYIVSGGRFGLIFPKGLKWTAIWRTPIRHTPLGYEHAWYGPMSWETLDEAKAWVATWDTAAGQFAYSRRRNGE